MPRLRQAQGRPGTAVIPTGWADAHALVVDRTLSTTCTIRHPGTTAGTFNPATGRRDGAAANAPHFSGPCEVSPLSAAPGALSLVADEQVTEIRYEVKLERGAAPDAAVDDIVTVSGLGELVIDAFADPTQSFSRVLVCTRHQP